MRTGQETAITCVLRTPRPLGLYSATLSPLSLSPSLSPLRGGSAFLYPCSLGTTTSGPPERLIAAHRYVLRGVWTVFTSVLKTAPYGPESQQKAHCRCHWKTRSSLRVTAPLRCLSSPHSRSLYLSFNQRDIRRYPRLSTLWAWIGRRRTVTSKGWPGKKINKR